VGWLPNRLPVTLVTWLYNEVPSPPGRAAVWLERGARASPVIRHARRGFPVRCERSGVC
jgi:hypothetical protein